MKNRRELIDEIVYFQRRIDEIRENQPQVTHFLDKNNLTRASMINTLDVCINQNIVELYNQINADGDLHNL